MTEKKGIFFTVTAGCMEICWLYAWSSFSLTAIIGKPFSFSGAIVSFFAAAILTHVAKNRGWRNIVALITNMAGLLLAALWIIHVSYYWSYGLFNKAWLLRIFDFLASPVDWIVFIIIIIFILLFWVNGILIAKRPKDYYKICGRFDIGLTSFFMLFLFKFVLLMKGGIKITDPVSSSFIFPFLLFGLIAVGSVRNGNSAKSFISGYSTIGFTAVVISIVLLIAGSLLLFFLPVMAHTAELGYNVIKNRTGFFSAVISILRFLFSPKKILSEPPASSKGADFNLSLNDKNDWLFMLVESFVRWVIPVLLISLATFMSYFIFRQWIKFIIKRLLLIFKWLFSRNGHYKKDSKKISWMIRLIVFLKLIYRVIRKKFKRQYKAVELFKILQNWGRRCGIPFYENETALEYSLRLNKRFPVFEIEINEIINAFNMELYGKRNLSREILRKAGFALRELRSPLHWPLRLISLLCPGKD